MKKYNFSELFEQYRLPLYRYLLQMSRNPETAEELLQETFYRAMVSLKVQNVLQAKAWLFKVARNLYIDWTRKSKSEQRMMERIQVEYQNTSQLGNPERQLEFKDRQRELEELLGMLPERMQTILYLREIHDFSYKELATALSLTESQVKVTLHRARQRFRELDQKQKGGATD
ncbi:RNA polymerase sigma factor [Radiobacillus deserti]|uniref:Sigma-70 family RNA polymerase sigma factor n=1 Tax=Radiobacillus deserti TaxID=2594883 RepID=A0A516KEL8_9BACI|nr:sigma-70 family RNA polymerase sigma factor [Radiobacillus deserti]QDP39848.1 sigma-70 family RNA polymerase sigma factor [Radiobacillus deserti]